MPRFTLNGFYEYFDKKLFDSCEMPDSMDKDIFVDTLIAESGQLYPYPCYPAFRKNQRAFYRNTHKNHLM